MIDKIQKRLNRKKVVDRLHNTPTNKFIFLNNMNSLSLNDKYPNFVFYKYRQFIKTIPIEIKEENDFSFSIGKFRHLYMSDLLFGYLFEFPKIPFNIDENYMKIINNSKGYYSNVNVPFKNKYFTIFEDENNSALITLNNISYINI